MSLEAPTLSPTSSPEPRGHSTPEFTHSHLPEIAPDVLQDESLFPVQANATHRVKITDPYPANPNDLTTDDPDVMTSERDVVAEVDEAFYAARDALLQHEGAEPFDAPEDRIDYRTYKQRLKAAAKTVADNEALNELADSNVEVELRRSQLDSEPGAVGESGLAEEDREKFWELSRELLVIKEMVGTMPKKSRNFFKRRVSEIRREREEGVSPDAPTGSGSGTPARELPAPETSRFRRTREALRRPAVRTIGAIATLGAGYLVAKGIMSAEHANALVSGSDLHMQLDAYSQPIAHGSTTGDVAHAVSRKIEYGVEQSRDKVSHGEFAGFSALWPTIAIAGLVKHVRKNRLHHEHQHHIEVANAHEEAEAAAIDALLDPNIPDSPRLVASMRHPLLLNEFQSGGTGPTGAAYSHDVVRRYARIIAQHSSGNAASVREHIIGLLGGEHGEHSAHGHGIHLDHFEVVEVPVVGGGTTIDIHTSDENAIRLAQHLAVAERTPLLDEHGNQRLDEHHNPMWNENLGLANLAENPFGDPAVAQIMRSLTFKQNQQKLAFETRFTLSGEKDVYRQQREIAPLVNALGWKIAKMFPTNEARAAGLKAMRLDKVFELRVPDFETKEELVHDRDPVTGELRRDPRTGKPLPAVRMMPTAHILDPSGNPIPDPANPGEFLIDPRSVRPYIDPRTRRPVPITRTRRTRIYREVPDGNTKQTTFRVSVNKFYGFNGQEATNKLLGLYA